MAEISISTKPGLPTSPTLGDLLGARVALDELGKNKELPAKFKYWLAKLQRISAREADDFEDFRLALVEELGETSKDTKNKEVPPTKLKEFRTQLRAILDQPLDAKYSKFQFSEVGDLLTSSQLAALWFMIDGEPAE